MTTPEHALPQVLQRCGVYILILVALLWFVPSKGILFYLFHYQDMATLVLVAGMLLAIAAGLRRGWITLRPLTPGPIAPVLIVLAVFVVCAAGPWLIFGQYVFSRDEVMADFDAAILRTGHLMIAVPPRWIDYSDALVPMFRHEVPGNVAWVSNYLPGNAMLRALADLTIGKAYAGPMLAAIAAVALYRVARRLWPQTPAAPTGALVLLATSPQFLVTGMTAYAMTAHLALNLLWLWCFLRNDRRGVAGALAVGFLATGLHQILFHPLFVLPFIVELLLARRWSRAVVYGLGYAAIGIFWISYWSIAFALSGIAGNGGGAAISGVAQLALVAATLVKGFGLASVVMMFVNVLRLVAWQHILIVPLAVLAWPAIRRAEGSARPLAGGILLTLIAMFVLMPNQGYGWGYRYEHGMLGSLCLLAVYGWQEVAKTADVARLRAAGAAATIFTVLVMLPLDVIAAYRLVRPYRVAHEMIAGASTPIVLVDAAGSMTGQDLVRNAPDLSNRPLVMDLGQFDAAQVRDLCTRYPITLFGRREAALAAIPSEGEVPPDRRRELEMLGCRVESPASWTSAQSPQDR